MDVDISLDYGLTLLAALLIGTGFVLQQYAAQREPDSRFLRLKLMTELLRTPRWLAGIACMIAGQVIAAWSIGHLSLAFVEPLLTMNLVFALVIAVPLAKASLTVWEVVGAAVLITGVALLSASRSVKPIGLSFGSVSHWFVAAVIAGIAALAVHAGLRRRGRSRAMLTGVGAGLVFGIQDALTRQTLEILQSSGISSLFTTWAPYALVGAGAIGIWLMQSAFNAGPLNESLPAISAGEPLVGLLLGVIVFGDRIQVSPGLLAMQAAGIVALVVGVIMVARAPALSQLRSWTPPSIPHPIHPIHGIHLRKEDGSAPADMPSVNGQAANGHAEPAEARQGAREESEAATGTAQQSGPDLRGLVSGLPRLRRYRGYVLGRSLTRSLMAPDEAQPRIVPPRAPAPRSRSSAVPMPPSSPISFLIVTIIVGSAQKSPHTHKMAAPICWSA
jgi:drug/metabolite transporter (DMT)-like permease